MTSFSVVTLRGREEVHLRSDCRLSPFPENSIISSDPTARSHPRNGASGKPTRQQPGTACQTCPPGSPTKSMTSSLVQRDRGFRKRPPPHALNFKLSLVRPIL